MFSLEPKPTSLPGCPASVCRMMVCVTRSLSNGNTQVCNFSFLSRTNSYSFPKSISQQKCPPWATWTLSISHLTMSVGVDLLSNSGSYLVPGTKEVTPGTKGQCGGRRHVDMLRLLMETGHQKSMAFLCPDLRYPMILNRKGAEM